MEAKAIVKQIIDSSTYLSLATTDGVNPWVNAVFYAPDKNYNLYFASYNDSLHVQNILKNPNVAVAIFDSHIIPGGGRTQGLQIKATCKRLAKEELLKAIEILYAKRFPDPKERATRNLSIERFIKDDNEDRVDHIYKIIPQHFYILDTKAGKDTRVEVSLF